MKTLNIILNTLTVGAMASAVAAKADLVTGYVWEESSSAWESLASPAGTVPSPPPSTASAIATFGGSGPIAFDSAAGGNDSANYTIGSFLGTGGYSLTSGFSHSGDDLNNTLFEFVGFTHLTAGQTISVRDDDGVILSIGGTTVIDEPQPQSDHGGPWEVTWTGATGDYSFTLLYAEVMGAPGELYANLSPAVPEPSTIFAGALLLLPFGISTLRIIRKKTSF